MRCGRMDFNHYDKLYMAKGRVLLYFFEVKNFFSKISVMRIDIYIKLVSLKRIGNI